MNWGYRILLLYLSFVVLMTVMVFMAVTQKDIHLVAKDYYKQEIAYQEEINKIKNAGEIKVDSILTYSAENQLIEITLDKAGLKGEILFFRPSDAFKDFKIALQTDDSMKQFISTKSLTKGLWRIKMNWDDKGKPFYFEQKIFIK